MTATVHKVLLHSSYGYLLLSAVLHFFVDVLQQYWRGERPPGAESTYYYGLHTAYSLGQVAFAVLALIVIGTGSDFLSGFLGQLLSIALVAAWFVLCLVFFEYFPPKLHLMIVSVLLVAAAVTSFASRTSAGA
ncbi:hypothetical protein ACFWN2_10405 [Lentzea sp. NPDC058436]|uniref:hypothetical protein n=1 Tax=Lentzea sp. NPDC058436 TaxID=3346499 RepID=UPI003650AAEB